MAEKSIRLTTEEVRAVLEGRKTQKRIVIKPQPEINLPWLGWITSSTDSKREGCACWSNYSDQRRTNHYAKPQYQVGDILWVRETWQCFNPYSDKEYVYKATNDCADVNNMKWLPSIHMPREAARLFLQVKNVRVERLQDISIEQIKREGIYDGSEIWLPDSQYIEGYSNRWNSCLKSAEIPLYGWDANCWVWVIEFERVASDGTSAC